MFAMILTATTIAVPPAAKVVAASIAVYGVLMGLKKIPALTKYITGWVSLVINVLMAIASLFVPPSAIDASNLYTTSTLLAVINAVATALTTSASAAGIQGTIKSFSKPQVLATIPPDPQVKSVDATLTPDNPKAVALDPKKES